MTINPIETTYGGCRFRSRLEARWAVFLDQLKYPWVYESEGFELPSGRYLPDFWLPEQQTWLEVKGKLPNHYDFTRFTEFAPIVWDMGARFRVLIGDIPRPYPDPKVIRCVIYSGVTVLPSGHEPFGIQGTPGNPILIHLADDRVSDTCGCNYLDFISAEWLPNGDLPSALYAARAARFEHGESGTP